MLLAADTETPPIRHLDIAPRPICLSSYDGREAGLIANGDPYFVDALEHVLKQETVWCNAGGFDLPAISFQYEHLVPLVCTALAEGRVHDVKILEKLLTLATHGNMRFRVLPNGVALPIKYDLSSLAKRYLGKDRSAQKGTEQDTIRASKSKRDEEEDDALAEARGDLWRYNYDQLDGWRAEEYPPEARDYAIEDSLDTYAIYLAQLPKLQAAYRTHGLEFTSQVETLHVSAAYYLTVTSGFGVSVDLPAVEELRQSVEAQLSDEALPLLIASGVLRPSQPARKAKARRHDPGCLKKGCGCGYPEIAAVPSSKNLAVLHELITHVSRENGLPVKLTETGRVSAAADVLEELAPLNEVLHEFQFRESLQKLVTTEIPRMSASVVHPHYNELVSSGRTSCSATKLYPSGNIQNVDPRARRCYVPSVPGWFLLSVDYGGMELVTLAQTVYSLFGHSTLRDQINAGVDPHSYLGAQLAMALAPEFRAYCQAEGATSRDQQYALFIALKKSPEETEEFKFFVHYRTLAKPTGLGYAGGLGPDTFIVYAKGQYGVKIDRDTAVLCREVWRETYPEMPNDYFPFLTRVLRDVDNTRTEVIEGRPVTKQRFWYHTPLGMLRRGCSFTEGANGLALQSPGAELAKLGLIAVARKCFDHSQAWAYYQLYRLLAFIHDELLGEVAPHVAHEVATEVQRIMVEAGQAVVPDVKLTAEAALMLRWSKSAKPRYDENKRLVPWVPKEEQ